MYASQRPSRVHTVGNDLQRDCKYAGGSSSRVHTVCSFCLSARLSTCLPVCPSASSVYLIACLPIHLPVRPFCPLYLFACLSVCLPCRHVQSHPSGTFSESSRPMRRPRWGGPGIRCEAGRRRPVARRWSSDADVRMRMCGRRDAETRWRGAVAPAGDVREPGLGIGEPGHRRRRMASVHEQPPGAARSRPSTRCFALYTGCGIITKAIFGHWP